MFFSCYTIGKKLLEVADMIDPGLTRWRGELLFELQSATVVLANRAFNENRMTAYQAKVSSTYSMQNLDFFFRYSPRCCAYQSTILLKMCK